MKEIPLTRGKVAIVDDGDFPELSKHKWYARIGRHKPYAVRTGSRNEIIRMHRVIMNAPDGLEVDHISGDTLDNRRANLRICTRGQNAANIPSNRNKNGFKGVHKSYRKFHAKISCKRVRYHLGPHTTPEEAARTYDRKAIELFGEFASLNFPRSDYA